MGLFEKIRAGLKKTRDSVSAQITQMVNSFTKIDEELFEELEELLVMGDVGVETSQYITGELRRAVKEKGITDPGEIMAELKAVVAEILQGDDTLHLSTKPSVILVIGVNGVGKTTTIGKLASRLKGQGKSVILGAADTFRAAAIEQLEVWAQRADVPLIKHGEGADPAAVVFDTISAAKARGCDVVICDTAGRLHNKKNLMDELSKISRVIQRELPDCDQETLLVLDAATGQNAVNQAREFQSAAGITGIVLTKLDGTPKGGVVLPIKRDLGLSVKFVGVGEQVDDLQPFDAAAFADALFETGDREETEMDGFPETETESFPETEMESFPETEGESWEDPAPEAWPQPDPEDQSDWEDRGDQEPEEEMEEELGVEPEQEPKEESEEELEEASEAEEENGETPAEEPKKKKRRFWPFGR